MIRSLTFFSLFVALSIFGERSALYLTWIDDPTSTMAISWHTGIEDEPRSLLIQEGDSWKEMISSSAPLNDILIHRVFLQKLIPDTEYAFRFKEEDAVYQFRTAPATLAQPLKFVVGGDLYLSTKLFRKMNQTVVSQDPLFVVIGGDIAYAIKTNPLRGEKGTINRWLSFLEEWSEQMATPEGRLIPLLPTSGNHDITPDNYEAFFSLFPMPKKQFYRAIDFGNYLSLILLDTGHFQPIQGQQSFWLDKALALRAKRPYLFAVYHEGAYPSYYPFEGETPKQIRAHWCPLFEKWGVQAAFEHHNHAFKRSYPIRNGKIDPKGIIYLGDGCWGVNPRKPEDRWYIEKKARKNNIYLVELNSEKAQMKALDLLGDPLDEIELKSKQN